MLTITAAIREISPDHRGGYELAGDEISMSAEDYDQAIEQLQRTVPDGWQILAVRVDR